MLRTKWDAANFSLIMLILFYTIMLGGGNYEQMNVTRIVASAPPKSMAMMQGPYGFSPVLFWATFRPLTILLFIIVIITNWNYSSWRRKLIGIAFCIDLAITISTFLFFAPETGTISNYPFDADSVNAELLERCRRWGQLNYIRLGAFYAAALVLLTALKSCEKKSRPATPE